ncbi:MAG: twin-arginine translocase subunit TatC [Bdellovibrionales bacterium]|nr:twin-arginine translocase subunit TatC [Bdellovibrionales bacterium]
MTEVDEGQTLVEHLTELRTRLIWSILFILGGFFVCWGFSEEIFNVIRGPISPYLSTDSKGLIFTAPMDKFMAHLKVSFLASIILTCPLWLGQVWLFVAPGLYANEKKYVVAFIAFGSALFLSGVSFVYFVVYPAAFAFLMNFGGTTDVAMISISEYLSFFTTTTLVFGAAFEMPLILTILGMMGIIDHHFLSKMRRYALVLLAALSAMVTPPDVVSMILMLIPMFALYESSVVLVRIFGAKRSE